MLFDSHTHVHFPIYDKDRDEVLKRAKEVGVKMICVGTQAASSEAAVELAKKNQGEIWATAGFHPNHFASVAPQAPVLEGREQSDRRKPEGVRDGGRGLVSGWYHDEKEQQESEREEFDAKRLRKIAENPEVVAIGEFGLDYYRLNQESGIMNQEKEDQQEAFEVQVGIAKDFNKALMMHCRPSKGTDDAYEDAFRLLSTYDNLPPRIFHFYVGSLAITKKLVDSGAYFTFGGVITFSRDYDEIIKYIPLARILLETDAPYVAPIPYRGKRNEPSYVVETAKKLAEIKELNYEKISEITTSNAEEIFKL